MKALRTVVDRITVLVIVALVLIMAASVITGCQHRQSNRASYNVSLEADNFNVTRRLVVTNVSYMAGPTIIYEMTGNFSITTDNVDGQLEVTCEVHDKSGKPFYTKHFVRLNEYTTYVVEDLSGANVTPYKYQLNFLPEMIVPITITSNP